MSALLPGLVVLFGLTFGGIGGDVQSLALNAVTVVAVMAGAVVARAPFASGPRPE